MVDQDDGEGRDDSALESRPPTLDDLVRLFLLRTLAPVADLVTSAGLLALAGLVALAGLAACGGRSVGVPWDGRAPDGGVPDAFVDATIDARPDARADAGATGCVVPDEPVVIEAPGEPCFVYSLDRMSPGGYVLGGAQGWPGAGGLRAGLWLLDDALQPLGQVPVPGETVLARHDPGHDEIVAVAEEDNVVTLRRYDAASLDLPLLAETAICTDCVPAWSSPALGPDGAALAVRHLSGEGVRLYVVPRSAGSPAIPSPATSGDTPHVAALANGPALLYTQNARSWRWPFDWRGAPLADPTEVLPDVPAMGLLGAANGPTGPGGPGQPPPDAWTLELADDGEVPTCTLLSGLAAGPGVVRGAAAGAMDYVLDADISVGPRTVAAAWGVTFGAGQVGAHLLVFDDSGTDPLFGPALISEPTDTASSSYSVWAAAAPHPPTGHAVVWGAWRESTHYGLYGKVIRCTPRAGGDL